MNPAFRFGTLEDIVYGIQICVRLVLIDNIESFQCHVRQLVGLGLEPKAQKVLRQTGKAVEDKRMGTLRIVLDSIGNDLGLAPFGGVSGYGFASFGRGFAVCPCARSF